MVSADVGACCSLRTHVPPGEADGAQRGRGPGVHPGEPEHPGVLPGPREQ